MKLNCDIIFFEMRSLLFCLLNAASVALAVVIEAESATRAGVLTIESAIPGFTGTGYVAGWDSDADSLTFSVSGLTAGSYDLGIVYSAQFGDKFTKVSVNGAASADIAITNVTTSTWTAAKAGSYALTAGTNTVRLDSFWGYYYIDSITVIPTPSKPAQNVDVTNGAKVEAEDGIFNGVLTGTSVAGFSGTGYVESFDGATDSLTLTVTSTAQALYNVVVRYAAPYGYKQTTLTLNGASSSNVIFEDGTGLPNPWADANGGQVLLKAGSNTLTFTTNW